jgi:hypothetical protein
MRAWAEEVFVPAWRCPDHGVGEGGARYYTRGELAPASPDHRGRNTELGRVDFLAKMSEISRNSRKCQVEPGGNARPLHVNYP